ncbi:MAG TPA: GNAT family protein [Solirubrobacteraceae bacterium]|jgi:ribosomal-protein-alanine N-acetyltransferase|nr:GNAT family protein [Solirubrobacteraceae bacterium]
MTPAAPASSIRLVTLADAPRLATLLTINRDFLAPWDPIRPEVSFTAEGQRHAIRDALEQYERGVTVPEVILADGQVVGRATLSNMVRGPFLSCNLGYWVDAAHNGRGIASAAVRQIVDMAFTELDLHRVEAGTLPHNVASQRVLERNGFIRFGVAPDYLRIAGRWQDHILFQTLNQAMP